MLATGPRRADAIAVGYLFDTNLPDGNWVVFDDRLAPLGYAYLLIHHGRGTLASCMFTGFKRQASTSTERLPFSASAWVWRCTIPGLSVDLPTSGCPARRCRAAMPWSASRPDSRTRWPGSACATPFDPGCSRQRASPPHRLYELMAPRLAAAPAGRHGEPVRLQPDGRGPQAICAQEVRRRRCRLDPAQALPTFNAQSASLSSGTLPLSRATARPQLRSYRLPLRLVPMPGRTQSYGADLTGGDTLR